MKFETITSLQNPRIKNLKLLDKPSERRSQSRIVIEGLREIYLAVAAGVLIDSLFISKALLKSDSAYPLNDILEKSSSARFFEITEEVYASVAYRDSTEGIIAIAEIPRVTLEHIRLSDQPLVAVLDAVEKPGNLGAILRTCDAVGVDAVIICDQKTDVFNPNVIRSSLGTVFTNQIAVSNHQQAKDFLDQHHIKLFAADPYDSTSYASNDYRHATAFVLGSEAEGLSDFWKDNAQRIQIPMRGKIDSLNVSVSAAVLLYEAMRQRQIDSV